MPLWSAHLIPKLNGVRTPQLGTPGKEFGKSTRSRVAGGDLLAVSNRRSGPVGRRVLRVLNPITIGTFSYSNPSPVPFFPLSFYPLVLVPIPDPFGNLPKLSSTGSICLQAALTDTKVRIAENQLLLG